MDSFPFSISDVVSLLNLTVRRRQARSMDVDCPFCGRKKGKLNVSLEKNVFRCNYCGEHGGMISLYAKLHNLSNAEGYSEICELLHTGSDASNYEVKKTEPKKELPPLMELADTEDRHQTYSMLLTMLTLSKTHKEKLLERGLTEEQIMKYGYRSTPAYGFANIAAALKESGCVISGVPGFYENDEGKWAVNFNPKCSGIIIPVTSLDGRISAAQIRLDRPFDGAKYIWLSTASKKNGVSPGSPVHFIGDPADRVVYITEGPLKATIAHCLSGKTFASVAGVNQYANLGALFASLKQNGTEEIVEAYDIDKYENENVQKGCDHLFSLANKYGFTAHRIKWDSDYKGIDDFLLAKKRKGAIAGA